MSAKSKNIKPTTRQRKLIQTIATAKSEGESASYNLNTIEGAEAAIVRQFNQIQKDYTRLMNDVMKELVLVRGWLGTQAVNKRNEIRTMLNGRLSKT